MCTLHYGVLYWGNTQTPAFITCYHSLKKTLANFQDGTGGPNTHTHAVFRWLWRRVSQHSFGSNSHWTATDSSMTPVKLICHQSHCQPSDPVHCPRLHLSLLWQVLLRTVHLQLFLALPVSPCATEKLALGINVGLHKKILNFLYVSDILLCSWCKAQHCLIFPAPVFATRSANTSLFTSQLLRTH